MGPWQHFLAHKTSHNADHGTLHLTLVLLPPMKIY